MITKTIPNSLFGDCIDSLIAYRSVYRSHCEQFRDELPSSSGNREGFIRNTNIRHNTELVSFASTYALLKDHSPDLHGKKVLQIACNVGLFLEYLIVEEGVVGTGLDKDEHVVELFKEHAPFPLVVGDALSFPLEHEGAFDLVVAHHFLDQHYVSRRLLPQLVAEAHKALVPGGALVTGLSDLPQDILDKSPFAEVVRYGGLVDGYDNLVLCKS
jgi:SAM-dependent methyltransferase